MMKLKTAEVALLLGLTPRRVNQLAEEGIMVRLGHGEFDGPASIQAFVAQAGNRGRDIENKIDKEREEARLKKEQADTQELKNAKLRKELLPIGEVERVWSEQISSIRSGLLAVVSRVRQRVSLSVEDAVILDEEIRSAMVKLAGGVEIYDADLSDLEEGDGDPSPAPENQSVRVDGKGNKTTGNRKRRAGANKAAPAAEGRG
jgi:terminase small subunit / prophage DNA-packing protein